MVDPFDWSNWNTRRNASNRAGDRRHDDIVKHGYRFVARYDQDWPALVVGRLKEPKLSLSYQGSASVMAIAFAIAS